MLLGRPPISLGRRVFLVKAPREHNRGGSSSMAVASRR